MSDEQLMAVKYVSQAAAAEFLGVRPRTLEAWRQRGIGPRYLRYSKTCVRYRLSDIQAWVAMREVNTEAAA
jgi:predicted DNA-binding transcriptional regulator AlpA